jgi:hypothetical protein
MPLPADSAASGNAGAGRSPRPSVHDRDPTYRACSEGYAAGVSQGSFRNTGPGDRRRAAKARSGRGRSRSSKASCRGQDRSIFFSCAGRDGRLLPRVREAGVRQLTEYPNVKNAHIVRRTYLERWRRHFFGRQRMWHDLRSSRAAPTLDRCRRRVDDHNPLSRFWNRRPASDVEASPSTSRPRSRSRPRQQPGCYFPKG